MILVEIMFIIMWIHSYRMHTDHSGYNLRVRIYLNDDGLGKSTVINLFSVIFKGHCDALLCWQFKGKVTMMILGEIMPRILWIHSDQMHTEHHGHNRMVRIYLNGDDLGKGTLIILFFMIV